MVPPESGCPRGTRRRCGPRDRKRPCSLLNRVGLWAGLCRPHPHAADFPRPLHTLVATSWRKHVYAGRGIAPGTGGGFPGTMPSPPRTEAGGPASLRWRAVSDDNMVADLQKHRIAECEMARSQASPGHLASSHFAPTAIHGREPRPFPAAPKEKSCPSLRVRSKSEATYPVSRGPRGPKAVDLSCSTLVFGYWGSTRIGRPSDLTEDASYGRQESSAQQYSPPQEAPPARGRRCRCCGAGFVLHRRQPHPGACGAVHDRTLRGEDPDQRRVRERPSFGWPRRNYRAAGWAGNAVPRPWTLPR